VRNSPGGAVELQACSRTAAPSPLIDRSLTESSLVIPNPVALCPR